MIWVNINSGLKIIFLKLRIINRIEKNMKKSILLKLYNTRVFKLKKTIFNINNLLKSNQIKYKSK